MDRTAAKTPEEREKLYREVFSSDVFLTGTNAVTEHGELYNVDGNGNRVAAMLFGPKRVLVFAGCNKIVRDIDDAAKREKLCDARKCHAAEFGHAVHARGMSRHGRRAVRGMPLGKSHLRDVHGFGTPAREGQNSCYSHR